MDESGPAAAALTVSDTASANNLVDESGPAAADFLKASGYPARYTEIIPKLDDWALYGPGAPPYIYVPHPPGPLNPQPPEQQTDLLIL